jgi:heterodisulfide reductase subunit C
MKRITLKNLPKLYAAIAEKQSLILPVKRAGQTNFGVWTEDAEVDLNTLKTVKSAKDAFFPQSENLYTCYRDGKKLSIKPEKLEDENFVVFGIRGCDVRGIQVLDQVFMAEPVDNFYCARRKHGIIVSLACSQPEESCFCKVFGIDCAQPEGDVVTWITEGFLYWKSITEKGGALTAQIAALLEDTDEAAVEAQKAQIANIVEKLPYSSLSLDGWNGDALNEKFNAPIWEQLYKPCLACGTCTFVCPTCQCYDIKDYDTGNGIQRYRCWDSCMYSDFTMMAHGNNRTSQLQRFRQRFMHKLVYHPSNHEGTFGCVGCGRCLQKCPIHMNIVKVINALKEDAK